MILLGELLCLMLRNIEDQNKNREKLKRKQVLVIFY